jgi:hypothetical protein
VSHSLLVSAPVDYCPSTAADTEEGDMEEEEEEEEDMADRVGVMVPLRVSLPDMEDQGASTLDLPSMAPLLGQTLSK